MFVSTPEESGTDATRRRVAALSPRLARGLLLVVCIATACAGLLAGASPSDGAIAAGEDLTRLLRAMALIKAAVAAAVVAGVWWRLGAAVRPGRLLAYILACGAMSAGPGLIWTIAHVTSGALLLYGGFLASLLLLWRDEATIARLTQLLAARRAAHRT